MLKLKYFSYAFLLITFSAPALVLGQHPHEGCADVESSDFNIFEVFNKNGTDSPLATDGSLTEPVQFAFDGVYDGENITHTNIYFIERTGAVKMYDDVAEEVKKIGEIDVWGQRDNALMGISLNPDFKNNRWMYLWYAPNFTWGDNRIMRFSRFTLDEDNMLIMNTEKIIWEKLANTADDWHSGGPMVFDDYGDLWITVGNNSKDHNNGGTGSHLSQTDSTTSDEWGTSNTASFRGSILRIHPDSSEQGYRMPEGPGDNFGEHFAKHFEAAGNASLAAQYRDPEVVLPEIYTKGHRSNFSISVHPTEGWLVWADVNFGSDRDEFYLVNEPIFAGYPYFHGLNGDGSQQRTDGQQDIYGFLQDPDAPRNESPLNSGVVELPPSIPGTFVNLYNVAISGPLYIYDRNLVSDKKFPPHFHNTWMNFGFNGGMHIHDIDSTDLSISASNKVDNGFFSAIPFRRMISAKYGPDGALYILNYDGFYSTVNPGVIRVEYTGDCILEPIAVDHTVKKTPAPEFSLEGNQLVISNLGDFSLSIHALNGKVVTSLAGTGHTVVPLDKLQRQVPEKGVYIVRVRGKGGTITRNVSLF